jgi:hypothetical protein
MVIYGQVAAKLARRKAMQSFIMIDVCVCAFVFVDDIGRLMCVLVCETKIDGLCVSVSVCQCGEIVSH